MKVTDIVIYNLKGSFNTKRFVGPILDSQGSQEAPEEVYSEHKKTVNLPFG